MSFIIDRVKPTDATELLKYLKQVGGETDNLTFGAEGVPFSIDEEEKYLRSFENSTDDIMYVARDNGKIIASATLNRYPRRTNHRGEVGITVAKSFWNKGIGSLLLAEIINFAKENAFEIIDLQVRVDNYNAIHLYEKFGFKKLCTYPSFFKVNEKSVDSIFMILEI